MNHHRLLAGTLLLAGCDADLLGGAAASAPQLEICFGGRCGEPVLDFGAVESAVVRTTTVSLRSTGSGPLEISGLSMEGDGAFETSALRTPLVLAPMSQAELVLRFEPPEERTFSGRLVVRSNDRFVPRLELAIRGVRRAPEVVPDPCAIEAPQEVGLAAALGDASTAGVRVTAVGSGPCTITSISPGTAEIGPRLDGLALPLVLEPGASLDLEVVYRPLDLADDEVEIELRAAGGAIGVVRLTGMVWRQHPCDVSVWPAVIDLGTVAVGAAATAAVTFTAQPGAVCALGEIGWSPGSSADLSVLPGEIEPPAVVGPTVRITVAVKLVARAPGVINGTLRVRISDGVRPVMQVPVVARAVEPALCVDRREVALGAGAGERRRVELRGCGSAPVRIDRLEWSATSPALAPSGPPSLPLQIAAGASEWIEIALLDTATAGSSGTLVVHSDDPLEPRIPVRIVAGPDRQPSSAGRWLYFARADSDTSGALLRLPLQGDPAVEALIGPAGGYPCVGCHSTSPDGRYVVVPARRFPGRALYDLAAGREVLPPVTLPTEASPPAWRPDPEGEAPSYRFVYESGGDLHLASLGEGYLGRLSGADAPEVVEASPAWGASGEIAFSRGVELWIVPEAGGLARAVPGPRDPDRLRYEPALAPGGGWLAFTESRIPAGGSGPLTGAVVRLVDLGSGAIVDLPDLAGGRSRLAGWSLDGTTLAVAADLPGGAGGYDLWTLAFDPRTGSAGPPAPRVEVNTASDEYAPAFRR